MLQTRLQKSRFVCAIDEINKIEMLMSHFQNVVRMCVWFGPFVLYFFILTVFSSTRQAVFPHFNHTVHCSHEAKVMTVCNLLVACAEMF